MPLKYLRYSMLAAFVCAAGMAQPAEGLRFRLGLRSGKGQVLLNQSGELLIDPGMGAEFQFADRDLHV